MQARPHEMRLMIRRMRWARLRLNMLGMEMVIKKEGTDSVGATETKDDSASPAVPAKATASTDILDPEPSAPQLVVTPDTPALLSVEDEDSKRIGQDGITGRTVEITQ